MSVSSKKKASVIPFANGKNECQWVKVKKTQTIYWKTKVPAWYGEKNWINARYWTFRTLPPPPTYTHPTTHSRTKTPKMPEEENMLAGCMAGKEKWWLALSQGREKGVHTAAQAKQMGTCWTSGVVLLLTVDEDDGFWCPFSCWFSFFQGLRLARAAPASLLQVPVYCLNDCLILDQKLSWTVQDKAKQKPTKDCCCSLSRPGEERKKIFLLKLVVLV